MSVDANYAYVCTGTFDSGGANTVIKLGVAATTTGTNLVTLPNVTSLVVNAPIIFSGTTFGNIVADTVYYIKSIATPNITVSDTRTAGTAGTVFALDTASGTMTATSYNGTDIWKRIALTSW